MKIYHISYRKSRAITAAVIGAGSTALDKPGSSLDVVLLAEPGLSINMNQKRVLFVISSQEIRLKVLQKLGNLHHL